jgi:hypothetical protein
LALPIPKLAIKEKPSLGADTKKNAGRLPLAVIGEEKNW